MCDLFICWRFHALVASTSMAVPSLGVCVYNRNKFHGILGKMMGQEKYLLYIDEKFEYDAFLAEIKSKIKDLWMIKDLITTDLKERAKIARKQALLNGKLVKELLLSPLPHK
jgi:polysaccharide pyruvyl transferase WcaK-like protein